MENFSFYPMWRKEKFFVTVQDVQNNRPQVYALLRSVLNESHWDSAPRALHALSLHSQREQSVGIRWGQKIFCLQHYRFYLEKLSSATS